MSERAKVMLFDGEKIVRESSFMNRSDALEIAEKAGFVCPSFRVVVEAEEINHDAGE